MVDRTCSYRNFCALWDCGEYSWHFSTKLRERRDGEFSILLFDRSRPPALLLILSLDLNRRRRPVTSYDIVFPQWSFLRHRISTIRTTDTDEGTTFPPWAPGPRGFDATVAGGKRLRRFVLLLPRRADFHLLSCDTTESHATQNALPRAMKPLLGRELTFEE